MTSTDLLAYQQLQLKWDISLSYVNEKLMKSYTKALSSEFSKRNAINKLYKTVKKILLCIICDSKHFA